MPIPIISNLVPANSGYFSLLDPIYIQGVNYPVSTTGVRDNIPSGLRKEGMLVYVTANSTPYRLINQSWVAEPRATGLGDLNNVSIVGASSGQFLGFNGSIWTAAFASGIGGSTTFIGLTDVDVTGAISGDYLRYNGTKWVNTSGVLFSRLGPGTITGVKTYVVGSGATLQYGTDGVVNANKFQNYSTIPIALGGTSLNAVSDGAILYGTSTTTLEFNALDFKWDWNNHGLCLGANNISSQSASGTLHIGAYNTGVPPLYIQPRVLTAVPRDNVFEYNGSGFYFTNFYGTRLLLATTSMDINDIAVGTLGIAKGGTNNTSYNTSGILYYNGSAFTTIAPPTNASSGGLVQSFAAGPSLLYGGASGQLAGWDGRKWVASNSTSGTDNSISVILQPITTARNAIYPIGNVRGLAIRPLSTNTTSPFIIQNSGIVGNVLFEVSSTGDLNINQKITFNYPNNTILGITNPYIQSYADSAYDGGSIKFGIQSSGNGGNLWIQGSGNLDGGSIYTFGGGGSIDTRQGYIELGGPAASGRIKIYKSASTTGTLYNVWPTQTSGTIMVYNGSIAATSGDSLRYNGQYWFATGVSVSGGSGTSDHSALSNLTVGDPHTQYVYMGVSGSIAVTGHRNIIYASGSNAVGLEVKELNNASSFHCENAAGDDLFDLTNGQIIMKGPLSIGNYTAYLNFESQSTTNHTVRVADGVDGYLVVSDNIPDPAFKEFLVSVSPTGLSTFRTINSGDLPSTLIYASGTPSANNYLRYNGSVWVPSGSAGGGGISSLNGLSDSTQSLAVTTSGTDFTITTSGSTHLFNLPTATSSRRGALSSTDWNTFNGKQNLITGAATSITVADLGGDLAVVSNAFGKISTSLTNATEIGYISGVTSSVQTQLNNKLGTTLASGNIFIGASGNVASGVTLGGDATIVGTGVLVLANTSVVPDTYTYATITVDSKGRITSASSGAAPLGITSLNGLTNSTQLFAPTTSGIDFTITTSGSTHLFNLPDASNLARGVLSIGSQSIAGDKTFTNNVIVASGGHIRFIESSGTDNNKYVGFKAPTSIPTGFVYTLPTGLPTSTRCFTSNTGGTINYSTFISSVGGSTVGDVQYRSSSTALGGSSNFNWDPTNGTLLLKSITDTNNLLEFRQSDGTLGSYFDYGGSAYLGITTILDGGSIQGTYSTANISNILQILSDSFYIGPGTDAAAGLNGTTVYHVCGRGSSSGSCITLDGINQVLMLPFSVYMNGIASATTSNVLYYDTVSKRVTYGTPSAGSSSGVVAGTGIIITTSSPNYVVHVNPLIPMSLNVSGNLSLGLENPSGYLHIPGSATQPAIVFNTGTLVNPTIKNSLEVNASGLYFTDNDDLRGEVHTYEAGIMYPGSFYSNNVNNTGVLPITGYTYTASSGLLTNKILRITAGGNYQNNTGANATLRVGMLFGGIPIYSDATANIATSANIRPWLFNGFIHCSGSTYQNVFGKFELGSVDAASTGIGGLGANATIIGVISGSGSVNLNTNNEFKLTFIHSSTTGSLWVRTRFGVSEIV